MNKIKLSKTISATLALALISSFGSVSIANALGGPAKTQSTGTASTSTTTPGQMALSTIISKGSNEITRRLASLSVLSGKIDSLQKVSSSDKASLSSEVTTEVTGLTALQVTLTASTTISEARNSAAAIFSDYRVYALILPKVYLVKVADDQLATQTKLTALATSLDAKLSNPPSTVSNVAALQADLADMSSKISAAGAISLNVEQKVIPLQPIDYDSNHAVLTGYRSSLQTAQQDDKAALADAKTIISTL